MYEPGQKAARPNFPHLDPGLDSFKHPDHRFAFLSDKASAEMDVGVGVRSYSGRDDSLHHVEHLLFFMDTEKYPKENNYLQYLNANSGWANAYTTATSTNFHFEVAATPNTETPNPSNSNGQSTENKSKEPGVDVRDEFTKLHEREYSANRVELVVLGRESLDVLEYWIVNMFWAVPNKDLPARKWDNGPLLTEEDLLTQVFAKPVATKILVDRPTKCPKMIRNGDLACLTTAASRVHPGSYVAAPRIITGSSLLTSTYVNHIVTANDALRLFEECIQSQHHHIPKRPHQYKRGSLTRSSNVFTYEEDGSGIKYWADGVTWSPSRILDNFLIYRGLERRFSQKRK
ncbi:hypothetical protein FGG08_000960 [Glutinoglossum americanum]|uniref:Peptidase M16 N-terminal domain-containing protein n=1 Tax=Glutinoglossum americanum TaxID=1670608 RepID=A0A9P8IC41_9PEZI|nr:hypothetical protein FGG08_000960 [Glutinoglossum americanum]